MLADVHSSAAVAGSADAFHNEARLGTLQLGLKPDRQRTKAIKIRLVCLQDKIVLDIRHKNALVQWIISDHIACIICAFGDCNCQTLAAVAESTRATIGMCLISKVVASTSAVADHPAMRSPTVCSCLANVKSSRSRMSCVT